MIAGVMSLTFTFEPLTLIVGLCLELDNEVMLCTFGMVACRKAICGYTVLRTILQCHY